MKIFVLNLRGNIIGDSIKESALFSLLKNQYPRSYISTTGGKKVRELHKNNPNINRFYYLKELDSLTSKKNKLVKSMKLFSALLKTLKLSKGYDLIVLTQKNKFPYILIPKLNKIKFLLKENLDYKKYNSQIYFKKDEESKIKKYLTKNQKKKIGIDIESKDIKRCWSIEKFSILIQELLIKGYEIYLLGTDSNFNKEITTKYAGLIHDLIGKTDIRETALLIKNLDLYIGNDSGLTHIASAVNTNSITILIDSNTDILNNKKTYRGIKLRNPSVDKIIQLIQNDLQN
jgi:ADP-heptose:LPS heptosyltransferase